MSKIIFLRVQTVLGSGLEYCTASRVGTYVLFCADKYISIKQFDSGIFGHSQNCSTHTVSLTTLLEQLTTATRRRGRANRTLRYLTATAFVMINNIALTEFRTLQITTRVSRFSNCLGVCDNNQYKHIKVCLLLYLVVSRYRLCLL